MIAGLQPQGCGIGKFYLQICLLTYKQKVPLLCVKVHIILFLTFVIENCNAYTCSSRFSLNLGLKAFARQHLLQLVTINQHFGFDPNSVQLSKSFYLIWCHYCSRPYCVINQKILLKMTCNLFCGFRFYRLILYICTHKP